MEMTTNKTAPLRVRVFIDFWNFTLLVRGIDPRFQVDWKALGPALTEAVEKEPLAGRERCRFDGLHVVGSNDPSNRKEDSLKHWFLNTLPAFPGVETVLLERQKKRKPPACPVCRKPVDVCPGCGANMRGTEEKGVDIRLATDLMRLAWSDGYDIAVLVSADKDFVLAERVVRLYSDEGDVVLDPFCGSGTTTAVAKRHKRQYIGMEIGEQYAAMAARRVSNKRRYGYGLRSAACRPLILSPPASIPATTTPWTSR